jgi:alpha-tubulin suppressor-like RCC1 family protein
MSFRYAAGFNKPGLNTLVAPIGTLAYNLFAWGSNASGALGLGNTTNYSSPKQIGSNAGWTIVSTSATGTSYAIYSDGTLWAWGTNTYGQLGLNNITNYSSPKQVGALTNWSTVVAGGGGYTIAIKADGTLWSWGRNQYGQLGLGNTTYYSSPKQIGSLTNWVKAACGQLHTIAIKTDGTLWAWGYSNSAYGAPYGGQLGLGNLNNYSSPKQVGTLTNWLATSCGAYHTLATKTDGTLWAWGVNSNGGFGNLGCLGLGNNTSYNSPKQVGSLTDWSSTANGYYTSFGIKINGTIWSWGEGYLGQLGLNNSTYYSSPKQIGALTGWGKISGGARTSAAIRTTGSLWMWGNGGQGQLGLGNTTSYSSPKQVGLLTTWLSISAGTNSIALG